MGTFKINENSAKEERRREKEFSLGVILIDLQIKSVVPCSSNRMQGLKRSTEYEKSDKIKSIKCFMSTV